MKTYTVVLIVDKRLCDGTDDLNVYVAIGVKADSLSDAFQTAREEALKAYLHEGVTDTKRQDFKLCVVFEGSHKPIGFPWNLP